MAVSGAGAVTRFAVPLAAPFAPSVAIGADGTAGAAPAAAAAARSSREAVPAPVSGRGPAPGWAPTAEPAAAAGLEEAAGAAPVRGADDGAGLGLDPWADCSVTLEANASFSRLTTGASIVEDADLTNSPISLSLTMTALLSTPNSFASS